jgi:hypothetical protein
VEVMLAVQKRELEFVQIRIQLDAAVEAKELVLEVGQNQKLAGVPRGREKVMGQPQS